MIADEVNIFCFLTYKIRNLRFYNVVILQISAIDPRIAKNMNDLLCVSGEPRGPLQGS